MSVWRLPPLPLARVPSAGTRDVRWLGVAAAGLAIATCAAAVAASYDLLPLLVVVLVGFGALAIALVEPTYLFYAYCAAIPFNFALPPGPAGTIGRMAGVGFAVLYLVRVPNVLRPGAVPLAGWAYVLWTLASIVWARNPSLALQMWLSLGQLFLITVLIASIVARDHRVVRGALLAYAVSTSITACVAVAAYLQGTTVFSRATAYADDPALFSSIALLAAVVLLGESRARSTPLPLRVAALAALVVCVVAILLSGTRSAWIGLAAAIAAWAVLERSRRQAVVISLLAAGVWLVLEAIPGAGSLVFERAATSISTGGAGRTDIWTVGISLLAGSPVIGVGFANFGQAFTPAAIVASGLTAGPHFGFDLAAHNLLLESAVETGLVGAALLVATFATALLRAGRDERARTVVLAGVVGLAAQSMFLGILLQKQLWLALAIAFGLGLAGTHTAGAGRADQATRPNLRAGSA